MQIISTVQDWLQLRQNIDNPISLGYVPTMGALHQGHASLLARARKENDLVVLSIFINPTQYKSEAEYLSYPRPWDQDMAIARAAEIDYVFAPQPADFHFDNNYRVSEDLLSNKMEGIADPGVFQRMLTNVLKLLLLIRPSNAYFGEKDYQQLLLIQGLVKAFFINTKIIPCATLRDMHGLPLSSRNEFLTAKGRLLAQRFAEIFQNTHLSTDEMVQQFTDAGLETEYIIDEWDRRFCAVNIDDIRMIDNRPL